MNTALLFSSFPFISCEEITLSRITETDAPALWEIMGDDENFRYSPTGALSTINEVPIKIRQSEQWFRDRRAIMLGVYSNDQINKLLGYVQINDFDEKIESVSISITLGYEHTGKGYATSAINALCKYLIEKIKVNRIQAFVLPLNIPCERMLERCGFIKEGTIREAFIWPDKGLIDLDLFSLLQSDYYRQFQPKNDVNPSNIRF